MNAEAKTLFDFDFQTGPDPRPTDPETSWIAALSNAKARSTDRRRALAAHCQHPDGLTDFELAAILGRQQTSAGKRRGELRDYGLIGETEERRPAPSGSPAIVWKITLEGREVYENLTHHLPDYAHGKTRSESAA